MFRCRTLRRGHGGFARLFVFWSNKLILAGAASVAETETGSYRRWGALAGSFGGQLLARGFSSGGLACGLLGSGHFEYCRCVCVARCGVLECCSNDDEK